jgi:hypothetical protein
MSDQIQIIYLRRIHLWLDEYKGLGGLGIIAQGEIPVFTVHPFTSSYVLRHDQDVDWPTVNQFNSEIVPGSRLRIYLISIVKTIIQIGREGISSGNREPGCEQK